MRNIIMEEYDSVFAASFLAIVYRMTFNKRIPEALMHRLLYLSQRECIIQTGYPLINEPFTAGKNGPFFPELRILYKEDRIPDFLPSSLSELRSLIPAELQKLYTAVIDTYASHDIRSLNSICKNEYSYTHADNYIISTEDIKVDAERIKKRRFIKNALDRIK